MKLGQELIVLHNAPGFEIGTRGYYHSAHWDRTKGTIIRVILRGTSLDELSRKDRADVIGNCAYKLVEIPKKALVPMDGVKDEIEAITDSVFRLKNKLEILQEAIA